MSSANSLANSSRFVEHVSFHLFRMFCWLRVHCWVPEHVMSMSKVQIIRASVLARRLIPHLAAIYWQWAARRCSWIWPENHQKKKRRISFLTMSSPIVVTQLAKVKSSQELQCLIIVTGSYLQVFFCENTSVKNTLFPVYFKIFDIRLIHLGCSIEIQALSRTMDAHQGHLARHQSEWYAKHAGKSLTSFGGLSHATYYDAMILQHINTIYIYTCKYQVSIYVRIYMYIYTYM